MVKSNQKSLSQNIANQCRAYPKSARHTKPAQKVRPAGRTWAAWPSFPALSAVLGRLRCITKAHHALTCGACPYAPNITGRNTAPERTTTVSPSFTPHTVRQMNCWLRWTDYSQATSSCRMSAVPVITDMSPPSAARAPAWAVLACLVPSQMALSLAPVAQPVTQHVRVITDANFINALSRINIALEPFTFCGCDRAGPTAQVSRAKREGKSPGHSQPYFDASKDQSPIPRRPFAQPFARNPAKAHHSQRRKC